MEQKSAQKFASKDGKIIVLCDSDTSLGNLHDNLLKLKGKIVDRMVEVHNEEQKMSEEQKELDKKAEEADKKK